MLDNSGNDFLLIGEAVDKKFVFKKFSVNRKNSLIYYIDKYLKAQKKDLTDVCGIAFLTGQGGFTVSRIAATVVNILGFCLSVPVVGVQEFDDQTLSLLKKTKVKIYASAKYSAPPHIGGKQK